MLSVTQERVECDKHSSLTEDSSIIEFPKPSPFGELPDARMGATVEAHAGQRPMRSALFLSLSLRLVPISPMSQPPVHTAGCQVPHIERVLHQCLWQTNSLGQRSKSRAVAEARVSSRADSWWSAGSSTLHLSRVLSVPVLLRVRSTARFTTDAFGILNFCLMSGKLSHRSLRVKLSRVFLPLHAAIKLIP